MKTRNLILVVALSTLVLFAKAQDKYQFMIIEYTTAPFKLLTVSIDGEKFTKEGIDPKFNGSGYNANPLLAKVKEFQSNDWELMAFDTKLLNNSSEIYFAYMRKKVVQSK